MIVIGKTNVPEFTLEGYTRNDLFGVTRNPWNADLTPGGSSGGAAASVAAGFVPAAIGTDGGGSIRRPACHTGLVGYKPSIGRWPRADGLPAILTDFETVGSLARTVEDTLLLDAILRGPDPRDWRSSYCAGAELGQRRRRASSMFRVSAPRLSIPRLRLKSRRSPASCRRWDMTFAKAKSSSISRSRRASGMSSRARASPG